MKNSSLILLAILLSFNLMGQNEKKLDGTWSYIPNSKNCENLTEYQSFLGNYTELIFENKNFYVYNLLDDTLYYVDTFNIIANENLLLNEIIISNDTIKYKYENELLLIKKSHGIFWAKYRKNSIENYGLSDNIKSYIKSSRQKESWERFHNGLVELKIIGLKELSTITKKWKNIEYLLQSIKE